MRNRIFNAPRALLVVICASLMLCAATTTSSSARARDAREVKNFATFDAPQEQKKDQKDKQPKLSEAEVKAAQAIQSAADVPAAMAAVGAFLQKHPKSSLRPQVAALVADKIGSLPDPAQQIALAESYLKVFNAPGEADLINPYLLNAYISARRLDEAFALAATALGKSPDPVAVMINLPLAGREEAIRGNSKYIAQSKQLALQGIELIESDKKPAAVTDPAWADYKTKWLPVLYQTVGMLSHAGGDLADAKLKIVKATKLNPHDPVNYVFIGSIANDEYQRLAQQYKAASGATQMELLKKAEAQMDEVIDAYAHAIALAEGNAQYEQLRTDLRPDLESYYKHRHNQSTEGLQALIDKYKKP
jgi:hypothetical protein